MDLNPLDDEDGHHHLIPQNDTRDRRRHDERLPTAAGSQRSAFQIEDIVSRVRHRWKISLDMRYIVLGASLTVVLVLVFLFIDTRGFFSADPSGLKLDPMSSPARALYLLRQQQFALVSLWNSTLVDHSLDRTTNNNSSNAIGSSGFGSSVAIEDVKSAVAKHISLNKEIQEALVSPHRTGNYSHDGGSSGDLMGYYKYDRCRKVDQKLSERRTIEWNPRPDKYLFAICLSGQMSNHLICLEKHIFFAALLGRVLVIPSPKFDYQYDRVINVDSINTCLGRNVVISFDQFMEKEKKKIAGNRKFICYFSLSQPCYVDEDHIKKLKGLGVSIGGKLEPPWSEDIKKPTKRTSQEVVEKFV